ncbi:hypothetical protein ABIB76_004682 [Bradyrhizobium sp. i1.12.3]
MDEEGLELLSLHVVQAEAAKSMAIEVRDNVVPVTQVRSSFDVEKLKQ